MEPLPITADHIAGFLERCGRPRAAAWVDELGGNYERALQTIKELREQVNDVLNRLERHEPRTPEPQPRSNKSQWE
jgi:hypothetical protein